MSRGYFVSQDMGDFPATSMTAVAGGAAESNLWNPSIWSSIAAGDMKAGKWYTLKFGGTWSAAATGGTCTFALRIGAATTAATNVLLGTSNVVTLGTSLTNVPFTGEANVGVAQVGVAATTAILRGSMFVHVQGATAGTAIDFLVGSTSFCTVDQTVTQGIVATVTPVSQSFTCNWVTLQSNN